MDLMDHESWLFVFAAIGALGVIATFFRVDAIVIHGWWSASSRTPYTGREKVMAALAIISFLLCGAGFYFREPAKPLIITSFGPSGPATFNPGDKTSLKGASSSQLTVNGSALGGYDPKTYKLIGVCFHHKRTGDVIDEPNISKSGLYEIEPREIHIMIPWNDQFITELVNGVTETNYELLVVPAIVSPDSFSTIRQVVAMGAARVARTSGPP
jgi:hypothetical protein